MSTFFSKVRLFLSDKAHNFFEPWDPTALALFRIAFGFLMLLDIPQERGLEDADIRFGDPNYCFFPLFSFIRPLSVGGACVLYSIMWMGALGMTLGYKFHISCPTFLCPYVYFLLLDKSRWNNHSYLFALFTLLLWVGEAGNHLSLDALSIKNQRPTPRWNYLMLKFQIFILYFFAGLKKLDSDWVGGYSMRNLSRHWVFGGLRSLLDPNIIEFYMVHMGGLLFDLSVGFMLNFEATKKAAILASVAFHGLNSQVFDIGMFPYVCLASLILFCHPEEWGCFKSREKRKTCDVTDVKTLTPRQRRTLAFCMVYAGIQVFLPFSHFITRGYNNWTPGPYGYSWDMMVNSWETLHQKITVRESISGKEKYLDPDIWVANDRWSSHADMAVQYAHCISRNLQRFNISHIEVYYDIWKSLNGRFQQRIYDPRVNILTAPWSPFSPTPWLLPLLTEYSHYRPHFSAISSTLSNSSDVIFVADFPGLVLENFLPAELTNVSLTLLKGGVVFEQDGGNVTLEEGGSLKIVAGRMHKVYAMDGLPSCYFYTYTNSTEVVMEEREGLGDTRALEGLVNGFGKFMEEKMETFSRCLYLVVNSWLNLAFDVPMIVRKSL